MTPVRILLAICATAGFLVPSPAVASEVLSHDIPAQPLVQALSEYADQTGLQLVYVSGIAATRVSQPAPRGLPARDALRLLLADTGLHFEFLNDRTVRIFAEPDYGSPTFGEVALAPQKSSGSRSPVDSLEDVTVTATRWWLEPPTQAVAPVTVITRRDIERGGQTSIGHVLQALPMTTGSPLNTNVNFSGTAEPRARGEAGDGSVRVYLHDLPTVVFLNGRRLPNSGLGADATVDLNTLPIAFIERVEVLASGASAAFGADAVGGVINIVTQRAKPGLELSGTRTITERGDGEIVSGQAAVGFELLGGTWSLGIDYVEQDGVTMDRRRYSASPLIIIDGNGTRSPDGFNNMAPNGYFAVPEGNALGLEPGEYTRVPGASGQSSADYRPYDRIRDGFNPAPFSYSQTPNERATLWLIGSRPLNANTTFIAEALAHHRESAQQAAPAFYRTGFAPPAGGLGHPADNYYNPFGVDVPLIYRRLVETGNRATGQVVDLWRAMVGLEGNVARWKWELVLQGARSEAAAVEEGFLSRPRLAAALGPSGLDESGRIVCGPPDPATGYVPAASIIPGCVSLNLFGGAGSITEEQLAYVSSTIVNRGTNDQQLAQFISGGPAGQFLGRDLQWLLGAEYRREAGRLVPDAQRFAFVGDTYFPAQNTGLPDPLSAVSGAYDAYELFSSVQLPLLHDRRGSRDMALNIGLRWSDFDSFDGHATWQAGFRWQPVEELMLRASYGEVFRAPSLAELHEGPTYIEQFRLDPCGNDPTPRQRVNCAADGVPGGAYVQDGWGFMAAYGGNPDLEPETGHTLGAGLVYTPAWAEGLSASVDYFHLNRSNQISVVSAEELLIQCADHGNLCDAITRLPEGHVVEAATCYYNIGEAEVRALDLAINWSAMTRVGKLNSRLLATYLERWDRRPIPGGDVYSYAGTFDAGARPYWRASGSVDWRSGPWMASYAAEYIGSYSELVEPWPQFGIDFEPFYRRVEPALYHDVEAGFTFDSGVTVRAAITNVTDEDPPFLNIAPANTDVSTYRLLGRSYFLQLRYKAE